MITESKDKNIAFHNNVDADIWHWWNECVRNKDVLGDRNFTDQQIAELYWESKIGEG
tara:strand:- start:577 stop:747 length:171 start_codon:yes stop_codon:yes gene_type:complete